MNFIETKNLFLKVPSKINLEQWTEWINSQFCRQTIHTLQTPITSEMQWKWIENNLATKKRIILEIIEKKNNTFIGVVSLSDIDYEHRSAHISTIAPTKKIDKNQFYVYEARIALINYAFSQLSLNKIWGQTQHPENINFLIKNMSIGFEIEGVNHFCRLIDNEFKHGIKYFTTRAIFKKKKILSSSLKTLLSTKNIDLNKKKLNKILSLILI